MRHLGMGLYLPLVYFHVLSARLVRALQMWKIQGGADYANDNS